jgi:diguanylate cyclase (GGDEF)-like protein
LLFRIVRFIKGLFTTPLSDCDKNEFAVSINRINIARAKITTLTFVIIEAIMLLIHCVINRENLFEMPYICYGFMYVLMLLVMIALFAAFTKLGADVPKNISFIRIAGIIFIGFILIWCAGISLLDQLMNGQVIVYVVAIISVAITPILEPVSVLLVYLTVHILFLMALPFLQESRQLLFANTVNTSAFVVMSWMISCMRYKKQAEDFINKKVILKKNEELNLINLELQKANQKLEVMSRTDSLTGTLNRLCFEKTIKDEWDRCKRDSIPLSLIIVDIDSFKRINDKYGHQTGDSCIKLIADVLTVCAGQYAGKVARYGGDEFIVLLPQTDKEGALRLAELMRAGVEERAVSSMHSKAPDHVTISLGINTIIPSDELSIDDFISDTDKALYMAKERRNCAVYAMRQ